MNTVYLLLGSNDGDRAAHLQKAFDSIEIEAGKVFKHSKIYTTMAWGNDEQPNFLNQVICIYTQLSPAQLLLTILAIEKKLGRIRTGTKWMQRIIDIDILFFDDLILQTTDLVIPHPFIQDRKFVLIPLLEIASQLIHPVFKKNVQTLANECKDLLEVELHQPKAAIDRKNN